MINKVKKFFRKKIILFFVIVFFSISPLSRSNSTKDIEIQSVFQFGGIDVEPRMYRPSDFLVTDDNKIIICDSADNSIIIFGSDGSFIKRFGRLGQGPGEFSSPKKISLLDKKIVVSDNGNLRIQILKTTGECVETYNFKGINLLNLGAWICFNKDGDYYFSTEGIGSKNLILHYSMKGKKLGVFGEIYGEEKYHLDMGHDLVKKGKIPDFYKNRVIPIVEPNENFLFCVHRSLPLIKKFSPEGELIWEKELDLPEIDRIKSDWIKVNKEAPPKGAFSLEYWTDVETNNKGDLFLLFRLGDRMTVLKIDNKGDEITYYKGVYDKISMLSVHDSELWAFGKDSHKFYKFKI